MNARLAATSMMLTAGLAALCHAPARAADVAEAEAAAVAITALASPVAQPAPPPQPAPDAQPPQPAPDAQPAPPAAPPPFAFAKPVYDDTWATLGLGVGLVPSYAGSNDYIAFPLPLIVGRVGGVGISPNGPGFVLDFNSPGPAMAPRKGARLAFGPAFRFRNDRNNRISDDVVARAGTLDAALEVGGNVAIAFPNVLRAFDQLSIGAQVRWDVLGAHDGMIIEPQVSYRAVLGRAISVQMQISAEFVDDSFADYYFTVTPAQATATGLAQFRAEGGLNRVGTVAILAYDLDRNALNGGWSLTGVGGVSRVLGDAADTPYTAVRGDATQFIIGLGAAYTF